MLFTVMGFFKPGADTAPARLQVDLNEHMGQRGVNIRLAGPLRDRTGAKIGFMALVEAEAFDQAESYLQASPYVLASMYERTDVAEFKLEVGALS